jgi:hypothetical protein
MLLLSIFDDFENWYILRKRYKIHDVTKPTRKNKVLEGSIQQCCVGYVSSKHMDQTNT